MIVHPDTSLQYLLTADDSIVAVETLALSYSEDDNPIAHVSFVDGSPLEEFSAKIFGCWADIPFHMIDIFTATEPKPEGWYRWAESWIDQMSTDERRQEFALLCDIYNNTEHYDFSDAAWDRRRALGYALGEF